MSKADLLSMFPDELGELCVSLGQPKYRGKQIFEALYKGARGFDGFTSLPKAFRERLSEEAFIPNAEIARKLVSKIDGTVKYLYRLYDGETVESVFMRYKHGNTMCISTQVGCRMGCAFCASTKAGLVRSLAPSEMLLQILEAERDLNERVSNIVLMGMGEPLDNYDNVIKFLKLVNYESGLNIGLRHISLSTCGLVDKIDRLADEGLPVTLSISLHAPNDEKRKETMPIANKYSISQLLDACKRFIDKTGRRISFEYALISGVNDLPADAHQLGKLLGGMLCHVNLIPVNPIKERSFQSSEKNAIKAFTDILETYKINVTVRRKLGADINASCGQLRAEENKI
ncbi:MAG: 23S rRNA (adenine(2503)-C(2))-methyltransferase RlmN [Ruminococcaceae bacterium]|nr:23S rRNA (adenine(2503)-C(2))-methyltransferase RlmN [Oscillospiraceae bacterium]